MRFIEFNIAEGYKEVTDKFNQVANPNDVTNLIAKYRDLVNRNQVQGNERNIDWWGKQGWERFQKYVTAKSQQASQTQQKKRKKTGKSYTLKETSKWLIVVPLDKDASCFHGKGSDWCTTKPEHDYFEQYFRDHSVTLIYFLQKQTGKKWAIAVHRDGMDDYFDINDNPIGNGDFADQTGIPLETVMKYVRMVDDKSTDVSKKAQSSRETMKDQLDQLEDMIDDLSRSGSKERSAEIETLLLKTNSTDNLKKYMYVVANDEDNPTKFDQNIQNLIASKLPHMLKNVANITPKSVAVLVKNHPKEISKLEKVHPELVLKVFTDNPNLVPDKKEGYTIGNISPQLQKIFVLKDPLWVLALENLHPALKQQKEKIMTAWFKKNPDVYAVVTEPGLTDLEWFQPMSQEEYKKPADFYGKDAFEVATRENVSSL